MYDDTLIGNVQQKKRQHCRILDGATYQSKYYTSFIIDIYKYSMYRTVANVINFSTFQIKLILSDAIWYVNAILMKTPISNDKIADTLYVIPFTIVIEIQRHQLICDVAVK